MWKPDIARNDWTCVSEDDFEEYLKICPDYRCSSHYPDVKSFSYASNGQEFAEFRNGTVRIDPSLLVQKEVVVMACDSNLFRGCSSGPEPVAPMEKPEFDEFLKAWDEKIQSGLNPWDK